MERPPAQAEMPPDSPAGDRLDSWKEIAVYLKRGVRAVQRWEKEEGLPVHRHVHKKLDSVYAFREALVEFRKAKRSSSASADALAAIGHTFGVWARRREAKAALEDLKKMSQKSYVSSGHFAMVHLGLGDKDAAFDWLDKACAERYAWLVFLKVDPVFDCLSSDPRFATLAGKIGLV
ncbi:MAG TPA: hypothetical protein VGQ81_06545 [Acidobacteriota bacterium]|jgi:hypothetical protein|nr:hypothetical protein [Acidobacteriota bacterium]